ncbi:13755_t:CDS:10, partial [Acaulospora morrowiae]
PNRDQRTQVILSTIPFSAFFMLLGSINDVVTSSACKVLEKLLQPMNYADISSSGLKEYLAIGLRHDYPEVRILALRQVEKCLESEEFIQDFVKSPLFPDVLECLGFNNIPTSIRVTDFLVKLVNTSDYGLKALFGSESIGILTKLSQGDETVKFRVFDLIVQISPSSPEAFQLCESSGALNAITSELDSDDLLIRLNAVETFSKIIQSHSGYSFLERSGIIRTLIDFLSQTEEDIVLILLKCAVLKFFGRLSEIETIDFSAMDNKYKIFSLIDAHLLINNMDLKITSINIIGVIGHNPRGLYLLYNCVSPNLLNDFMDLHNSSIGEVKLACLQTISCLIGASENPTPEISNITEQIYQNPTPLATLITNAKTTIEELRIASFAVMQKIAIHSWGKIEMSNSKEFIDYIVNRTTEFSHKSCEWKFSIIQTLCSTSDAENIIAPNVLGRLRR